MAKITQLAVTHLNVGKHQAKKDSDVLMSAPVLAVISSKANDRPSQVKVGQVFERLWLMATALGISLQSMSQILEIPDLKSEVSKLIPVQEVYPMQTFRMGYAKQEKEHTPRRDLEEELI
jgi:nitroreductase